MGAIGVVGERSQFMRAIAPQSCHQMLFADLTVAIANWGRSRLKAATTGDSLR
ncbi:hypothetical protein K9N68_24405 [Kovacikia minuta CCNUW1]|uniref:hypothetical protein n=1 Tax=Kovacikia minuta TaxID=2931930 RepID=UPI001CCEDD19|nr:hypothetical protein [Kovacikia minuta]UBF24777.1 hypothetical protein K9N68_24405 [Kovacikia minuta CCNUW1]